MKNLLMNSFFEFSVRTPIFFVCRWLGTSQSMQILLIDAVTDSFFLTTTELGKKIPKQLKMVWYMRLLMETLVFKSVDFLFYPPSERCSWTFSLLVVGATTAITRITEPVEEIEEKNLELTFPQQAKSVLNTIAQSATYWLLHIKNFYSEGRARPVSHGHLLTYGLLYGAIFGISKLAAPKIQNYVGVKSDNNFTRVGIDIFLRSILIELIHGVVGYALPNHAIKPKLSFIEEARRRLQIESPKNQLINSERRFPGRRI